MSRYYVDRSSWFDTNEYNPMLIKEIVKLHGGKNVRLARKFGWSNLPQVVTFNANDYKKSKINEALQKALDTPWIIISKKDW